MNARRFLSFFIALAFFVLPVLSSGTAALSEYAQGEPLQYTIFYISPMDGQTEMVATEGMDFIVHYLDETRSQVWFELLNTEIPLHTVRVAVLYLLGEETPTYTFYDPLNQTEWINLEYADALDRMGSYSLVDEYGNLAPIPGKQLAVSLFAPPTENAGQYPGDYLGDPYGNPYPEDNQSPEINPYQENNFYTEGNPPQENNPYAENATGENPYPDINTLNEEDDTYLGVNTFMDNLGEEEPRQEPQQAMAGFAAPAAMMATVDTGPTAEEVMQQRKTDYAQVGALGARMALIRDNPDQIVTLTAGNVIVLLSEHPSGEPIDYTNAEGYWHYARLDNGSVEQLGYVLISGDITFFTVEERQNYFTSLQTLPVPQHETDMLEINAVGVALLSSPNGKQVQALQKGDLVTFLPNAALPAFRSDGGRQWVFVQSAEGLTGYVAMDTASFLTKAQLEIVNTAQEPYPASRTSDYAVIGANGAMLYQMPNETPIRLSPGDHVQFLENTEYPASRADSSNPKKLQLYVECKEKNVRGYVLMTEVTPFLSASDASAYEAALLEASQVEQMPQNLTSYLAVVKDGGADLMSSAGGGTRLETLPKGTIVRYTADNVANKTERWLYVQVMNTTKLGHVRLSAVTFMTAQEEATYNAAMTTNNTQSDYAYVKTNNTPIIQRDNPNVVLATKSIGAQDVILYLSKDADAKYMGTDGRVMLKVQLPNNQYGYIAKDSVEFMTKQQETTYLQSQQPTPTPTVTPTQAPTASTPPLQQFTGFARVTRVAPMVSWASLGATFRGELPAGEMVQVIGQQYGDDAKTLFNLIYYNGYTAWVQASYMQQATAAEIDAYYRDKLKPSTPPTIPPSQVQATQQSGYGLITDKSVNFRASASTDSSVLAKLAQNTIVRIIGETTSGGYIWYQCESAGKIGYVRGDFVNPLTIQQFQSIVTSPSYVQGGNVITPTASANVSGINTSTWATPKPNATSGISFVTIPPMASMTPNPDASASPDPNASASPDASASPGNALGFLNPTDDPDATLPPLESPSFPAVETGGFSPPSLLLVLLVILLLGGGGGYGYYVYNRERRKKAKELSQKNAAEARDKAQATQQGTGGQPAIRRPVPPGQPQRPGQPMQPGQQSVPRVAGVAGTAQQRPAQPQPGQPQRPGVPGGAQPLRPNPYARPQAPGQPVQQPRTQEVTSNVPRAQVDGRPLPPVQPNPYARPEGAQDAQSATTPPQGVMPVAPPPPALSAEGTEGEPRRRRRRTEDEQE